MAKLYSVSYEEVEHTFADPAGLVSFLFGKNGVIDIHYMTLATFSCNLQNSEMKFSNQIKASSHIHNSIFFPPDTIRQEKEKVSKALGIIAKLHLLEQLKQLNDPSLTDYINKLIADPITWARDHNNKPVERMDDVINNVLDGVLSHCKKGITDIQKAVYDIFHDNNVKDIHSKIMVEEIIKLIQEKIARPSIKASL